MPGLSAVGQRDPDGVRRRRPACKSHARRRAAGRRRGQEGAAVRRPGRPPEWQLRGKRRLHKTPAQREIDACRQWLEREIEAVRPQVIVALGATAARAVIGKDFKVSRMRGKFVPSTLAPHVFATFHPSALLRLQDEADKEAAFAQLVKDLGLIRTALSRP
jgi:uracil-DNA glycosylase